MGGKQQRLVPEGDSCCDRRFMWPVVVFVTCDPAETPSHTHTRVHTTIFAAGSKKAAESHRGGAYGRAGGQASLLSDDENEPSRPSGGYGALGRGGAAYGSSNSLRSQDRASDGGVGGAASTSGFSGFEDATEGMPRPQSKCVVHHHQFVQFVRSRH